MNGKTMEVQAEKRQCKTAPTDHPIVGVTDSAYLYLGSISSSAIYSLSNFDQVT